MTGFVALLRDGERQAVSAGRSAATNPIRRGGSDARFYGAGFTGNGIANRMDIFFEGIDLTMHIDSLILLRL
jgi:hypothetical protein